MKRLKKTVILSNLIRRMRNEGSWCGETSIQKAVYLLQEVLGVPLEFEYILYLHGPFAFDLRDELTALQADDLLDLEPQSGYGPRYNVTDTAQTLETHFQVTLDKYSKQVECAVKTIGAKGVLALERLATAIWVTQNDGQGKSDSERAKLLSNLKPHIRNPEALVAIQKADEFINAADSRSLIIASEPA